MRDGKEAIVPQISVGTVRLATIAIILALPFALLRARGAALLNADAPRVRTADLGHGITLHYVEEGSGRP
jgi:hypothetical protein